MRELRRRPRYRSALASLLVAWVLVVLSAPNAGQEAVAQPGPRPNIVVVMTDDQDAQSVRVMDAVRERLRHHGTTFKNFFATFPLCCPSRATFLTGQYAHNHGVRDNGPPDGGYERFEDSGTVAVSLARAGYRTGYIGKYLNGYHERRIPPGWGDWHVLTEAGMFDYELNDNGRIRNYGSKPRNYQTDVFARKAAHFIQSGSRQSRPFFLTVSPYAPHSEGKQPPRPAPRHRNRFRNARLPKPPSFNERRVSDKPAFVRRLPRLDRDAQRQLRDLYRGRLRALLAVDDAIERIVRELRETGELDNTLLIFTSDNGYLLGEHRLVKKTKLYEESARVPLIMRGPGIPEGETRGQVTGNIDLTPTILDAANADPRRVVDGISLFPLAQSAGVESGRDILLENHSSSAVRTRRHMYAEHPNGEFELYDLTADPFQLNSRHRDPRLALTRSRLEQRLRQLRNCAGSSCH
ncbi:MAG: sulfatase family protein [Thermoleophilaceae bacterium]